jgi:hypothetical protein
MAPVPSRDGGQVGAHLEVRLLPLCPAQPQTEAAGWRLRAEHEHPTVFRAERRIHLTRRDPDLQLIALRAGRRGGRQRSGCRQVSLRRGSGGGSPACRDPGGRASGRHREEDPVARAEHHAHTGAELLDHLEVADQPSGVHREPPRRRFYDPRGPAPADSSRIGSAVQYFLSSEERAHARVGRRRGLLRRAS